VRLLAVLLACLALPLGLWLALPLGGDAATPAQIQERIERTRDRIDRRRGTERDLSRDISRWSNRIRSLETRIGGLQRREASLQADLDAKRAELVQIQERLRDERARLARLRARLIVTRRQLAARLVEIYQADKPDVLSVILNSRGFAELLERQEFIGRIAAQDRRIVEIVRTARADAAATTQRLDRLERRQQRLTAIVLQRRNEVAQVKQELIGTRVGYQRTRAGKARALRNVRSQRVELQEDLQAMEAQQARIQAQLRAAAASGPGAPAAGPVRRGSGSLIWPANGPVSSPFGMRWGRLHAGIDIPLPEGTPLRAADSGRVAIAGWVGGYGNYTCIQHNASLSTCYGHQSSLGVSVGQNVSQGQVIGRSGNTGNSTGPHLHFEVRVGGNPVDPLGYL